MTEEQRLNQVRQIVLGAVDHLERNELQTGLIIFCFITERIIVLINFNFEKLHSQTY